MSNPLPAQANLLSADEIKDALPDKLKRTVNQSLIDQINNTLAHPDLYETFRENFLSYGTVLAEGKFKMTSYLDAVRYVSFKLMDMTNERAYSLTFPQKVANWATREVPKKDIASMISSYNKSKLVNLIYEQTLIPTHVLNQDLYQKALNVQAELMTTANSEMVRTTAANSLLSALKPPETKKVELAVQSTESEAVKELRKATQELAAQQRSAIAAGQATAQEIAHSKIIEGEYTEVPA